MADKYEAPRRRTAGLKMLSVLAALGVGAALLPAEARADHCDTMRLRLWTKTSEVWYDYGETVEILAGQEGHLYLHVKGRGPTPYTARAEIGYPSAFGLGGNPHDIKRHVRMEQQNSDDRRVGRVRFRAAEPGTTHLGYRITGVKDPGDLRDLARGCRVDRVAIRVVGDSHDEPERPTTRSASREVVELLYRSLLRRERHDGDARSFVEVVARQGSRGVEEVAESMLTSSEFRHQVLDRVQRDRPSRDRSLADLREKLLYEMYRDLYGNLEPSSREMDEDAEDLDVCLSTERDSRESCTRLARNLVTHDLFYERHGDLLDELDERREDRRDRRRGRDGRRGRRPRS